MSETSAETGKIQSLEGLRGVMAWWVIVRHTALAFGWQLPLIDHALAIDVFIILSGFVIARLLDRKRLPYGQFLARRIFRLFPLYLIALVASALLLPVQLSAWSSLPQYNASRIALAQRGLDNLPAHLLVHLPMLHGLIPNATLPDVAYTIIGQAWSLSLEWQFNLLAPFFVWALLDRRRWPLALVAVVVLQRTSYSFTDAYLGAKILLFFIGMFSHFALVRRNERLQWIGLAAVSAGVTIVVESNFQIIPIAIWCTVLLSSLGWPHRHVRWLADMLGTKFATHFGEMSYALYLVHMIPLYCSLALLNYLGVSGLALQVGVTAITLCGAYVLARLAYAAVERPSRSLGQLLTNSVVSFPVGRYLTSRWGRQ